MVLKSNPPMLHTIVERILVREGGDANHPNDFGGPTRFGITLPFLSDRLGRTATQRDLDELSRDDARKHYLSWAHDCGFDVICDAAPQGAFGLCDVMVDWAVQRTGQKAIKALQTALGTVPDGVIGPQTIAALSVLTIDQCVTVQRTYAKLRIQHRARVVRDKPSQAAFIVGWIDRDLTWL